MATFNVCSTYYQIVNCNYLSGDTPTKEIRLMQVSLRSIYMMFTCGVTEITTHTIAIN